jgi:ribosomal protein S27AE
MSCRKAWNREILVDNFTSKFINKDYKARRESLLLEREKSLMPATQPYVEIEKKIRELAVKMAAKNEEIRKSKERFMYWAERPLAIVAVENNVHQEFEARIIRHQKALEQHKVTKSLEIDLEYIDWYMQQLLYRLRGGTLETERRAFVRACPFQDCKGFLSTAWKCGMCENWTCPECHEVKGKDKDAEHTCDPNNVETAKLLAKDSRNCPKCAAMIFKIDGCDQMYCTQCHTAFSWRTGRVETGTIHNPHYYEFQRQRGTLQRNPGDVPCGGFPEWLYVTQRCPRSNIFHLRFAAAHRTWGHCQWVMVPRYTTQANEDNRDLRIKFMIGDINEDEFKKKIQQREKARQRKTEIRQVLEMYMAVLSDLFQTFVQDGGCSALAESLDALRNHFATTMEAVSKRYTNCATPRLSENFDWL